MSEEVFRLITFFISIVGFAAVVWFGVTVELGQRTLFGHLRAIGSSNEAQQLWDGTKEKVTDFVGIEAARRAEAAKAALKDPDRVQPAPTAEGAAKKPATGPAVERAPAPAKPAARPASKTSPAKQAPSAAHTTLRAEAPAPKSR